MSSKTGLPFNYRQIDEAEVTKSRSGDPFDPLETCFGFILGHVLDNDVRVAAMARTVSHYNKDGYEYASSLYPYIITLEAQGHEKEYYKLDGAKSASFYWCSNLCDGDSGMDDRAEILLNIFGDEGKSQILEYCRPELYELVKKRITRGFIED